MMRSVTKYNVNCMVIKSKRVRWARYIARMVEMRN